MEVGGETNDKKLYFVVDLIFDFLLLLSKISIF